MAQAGITLELHVGTGAEILGEYRARNHEIIMEAWGPDYPDPHTNADTFARNPDNSDEGHNTGILAWRNAWPATETNDLTNAAVLEQDGDKRAEMYEEIQRIHQQVSPFAPLFQQIEQVALRSNVEGFSAGGSISSAAFWDDDQVADPGPWRPGMAASRRTSPAGPPRAGRPRSAAARRIFAATLAVTLLGLLAVTFVIGRVIPIDPVLADHRRARHRRRSTTRAREALGLNRPLWVQFAIYVRDAADRRLRQVAADRPAGDRRRRPRLPGDARARDDRHAHRRRSSASRPASSPPPGPARSPTRLVRLVGLVGYSMPVFWLGLMGLLVFYGKLQLGRRPGPARHLLRVHLRARRAAASPARS